MLTFTGQSHHHMVPLSPTPGTGRCPAGALGCVRSLLCCWEVPGATSGTGQSTEPSLALPAAGPGSWALLLLPQILPFPFRKSGTTEWHLSSRRHLRVSTHQNNLLSKPGTNSFHPTWCHMLLSKLPELFRQHVGPL